jgi:hypothetical protein
VPSVFIVDTTGMIRFAYSTPDYTIVFILHNGFEAVAKNQIGVVVTDPFNQRLDAALR